MGDPKKTKKKYVKPRRPWNKTRLDEERTVKETYGLKNKKELWMLEQKLKNKRQNARKLLALELEQRIQREKELVDSLKRIGILKENASLDDVLGLKIEEFLERRLQTIIWRKGLANTPKQARQFIVHGHIAIKGKKITVPSYTVKAEEENNISYYGKEMKIKTEKPKTKKDLKKEFEKTKEKTESQEKKEEKAKEKPVSKEEKVIKKKEEPKEKKEEKKTETKKEETEEKPKKEDSKKKPEEKKKEEIAKENSEEKKEIKKEELKEEKESKETKKEKTEEKISEEKKEDKKIQKEKETKEEKKIENTKEKKETSKKEELKEEKKEEDTKGKAEEEKEGAEK
ncbi:MAG: 30S ribosomal protein S4 [Candidatus Micrarchaeota archaeon]